MTKRDLRLTTIIVCLSVLLIACGKKKESDNIITQRVEQPKTKEPVRMQEYTDERDVKWQDHQYHIAIHRQPSDSLSSVQDETGQVFIDNVFTVAVTNENGSVFWNRTFVKKDFKDYVNEDFYKTGILEGIVFDRVKDQTLIFAASVGRPQTDEYIPLILSLSKTGHLTVKQDTQMDTVPNDEDENN
jgi:hypothetical protein